MSDLYNPISFSVTVSYIVQTGCYLTGYPIEKASMVTSGIAIIIVGSFVLWLKKSSRDGSGILSVIAVMYLIAWLGGFWGTIAANYFFKTSVWPWLVGFVKYLTN